jgi:hypothetical protein
MNHHKFNKKAIQLFPAAMLLQPRAWEGAVPLLPPNTCLLVTDTKTQKQTQLMRQIAQSFRDDGWQVLIWMPPNKVKPL